MTTVLVPSIGAARRAQALCWLGWSRAEISRVARFNVPSHHRWPDEILPRTAARVGFAYDILWDQTPPDTPQRAEIRAHARLMGFAPPLAWDDDSIDDPSAVPQGLEPDERLPTVKEKVLDLLHIGYSVTQIPQRVGRDSLGDVLSCIRDPGLKAELTRRAS